MIGQFQWINGYEDKHSNPVYKHAKNPDKWEVKSNRLIVSYYGDGGEELGAKNGGEVYTCARRLGVGWANTPQCRDLATYLMIDRGWTL